MKALTLWQPWASLVAANAKPWEFRPRSYAAYIAPPKPGDRIAVHAAMRPVRYTEIVDILLSIKAWGGTELAPLIADRANAILQPMLDLFEIERRGTEMRAKLHALAPLGAVVCTAIIGIPQRSDEIFGRAPGTCWADYNWAWPLTEIEPFPVPIPATGQQGFWEWRP